MNQGEIQTKKEDEIYCPNCAKPIKKEAVICPHCGVQVKELKVSTEIKAVYPGKKLKKGKRKPGRAKKVFLTIGIIVAVIIILGAAVGLYWYRGERLDQRAWDAYYEGRPVEALPLYSTIERQYPYPWWFLGDFAEWVPYDVEELEDYLYAYDLKDSKQVAEAIAAYESFLDEHHRGNLYGSLSRLALVSLKLEFAQDLYNSKKYSEAIDVYQSVLEMEMLKSPDLEPVGSSDKWGITYQEAEDAVEKAHALAETAIPGIFLEWINALENKKDYEGAIEKYHIILEEYPDILNREYAEEKIAALYDKWATQLREDKKYEEATEKFKIILSDYPDTSTDLQIKDKLAKVYCLWANQLREEENYEEAIKKYEIILSEYGETSIAAEIESALAETYNEFDVWKEETRAVPVIEFSNEVRRNEKGSWVLVTTFKETGCKIGYALSGKGWIVDVEGNKYGTWGFIINRGMAIVPAEGENVDEYRFSGDTFIDGYAVFTWSGEDDNGHPIEIEEKVHLLP